VVTGPVRMSDITDYEMTVYLHTVQHKLQSNTSNHQYDQCLVTDMQEYQTFLIISYITCKLLVCTYFFCYEHGEKKTSVNSTNQVNSEESLKLLELLN
jgi:hypothetical protein